MTGMGRPPESSEGPPCSKRGQGWEWRRGIRASGQASTGRACADRQRAQTSAHVLRRETDGARDDHSNGLHVRFDLLHTTVYCAATFSAIAAALVDFSAAKRTGP